MRALTFLTDPLNPHSASGLSSPLTPPPPLPPSSSTGCGQQPLHTSDLIVVDLQIMKQYLAQINQHDKMINS